MKCTSCQSELAIGARLCKACGHPTSINPAREDLYFSNLAANTPPLLAQKIRSAPYLANERRTVTALMFTIATIDTFNQTIPEEERNSIFNQTLERLTTIIFQYEGTIAKLWENTVLVFFGAPVTHEDDPLRALHAAASILDEVRDYSNEIEGSFGVPLQINLVLNTGPILIGDNKSNLKLDFRSLNNTLECMDAAIRTAPQGKIILFEETFQLTKPFIECTQLENISCKEAKEDLHLWRVDKIIKQPITLQHMLVTNNSSFIGHQKELDLLLELTETVFAGLGRVSLIFGDPGIGKSRLILEWKRKIMTLYQPTQVRWIEARGLAFGRELAYHLLKDLLRASLEIPKTSSKDQIKERLYSALEDISSADEMNLYQYLAHLLDLQLSDPEEERIHRLNASELRAQYLNAIRMLLRNLAAAQPLVIILEDLHWADASSADLLIELLMLSSSSPILFCLVTRQEIDSIGWRVAMAAREKIGPRLVRIKLENLDELESQSLVKQLLEIDEIPDVICAMVIDKSEGNPYFIEELIRMLIIEGALIHNNDLWTVAPSINTKKIPDNLQGLLTARIDRLQPEARLTLRVASVIGRVFPDRVIKLVMAEHSPDVELMEQLSILESIGMIKIAQINPELTYKFQHTLLQDAAYHSIYETDRSVLHLTVGNALEKLYPDQKERLASQLAYHFLESKEVGKAFTYLDLAGHVSMNAFANSEAETFFTQAIPLTEDVEQLAHLYSDLGEALAQQAKHRQAIQTWEKAIQYHCELGNSDRLARIYAWSARSAWWGYDPKRSLEICLEGLKVVEGAEESSDIAYLIHETGRAYLFHNQPEKARAYSEQALEMAKRLDAYEVQAEALATIGILPTVKPEQAIAALEMAVKISESNNLYGSASRAYINLAAVTENLGEVKRARDYRKRAIRLGNKAGGVADELMINQAIANASLWLGDFKDAELLIEQMRQSSRQKDAYLENNTLNLLFLEGHFFRLKGDFSAAIEIFTDLIDRSRQANDLARVFQANRALAEVNIESILLGEDSVDQSKIDIALSMISETNPSESGDSTSENVATQYLLSTLYSLDGNFDKAENALEAANFIYNNQPVMQDRFLMMLAQARLETAQGNFGKALKNLGESEKMLEKMEGRWWRARIWLEMGDSHLKRNEPEDIDQARNFLRESLTEFRDMGVNYYPEVIIEKLRQLKLISRNQAIAHQEVNQEMAKAGRVQNTFIPTHSPTIPGYQISGILLPARETSGDFYDFIDLEDGKLGVVIADVGDKGAGAALYMAMSRTLIRTYAVEGKLNPEEVIQEVNRRILTDTQLGIFLTVVFGVLNPDQGTFTYVNAGHNPPYLLKQYEGKFVFTHLEKTGTLVGIFGENTWEAKTIQIHPGEVLVLYTDGIPEAQNPSGEFFGNERYFKTLENEFDPSAEMYRNAILESVQAFTGIATRLDDITLVVISRDSEGS